MNKKALWGIVTLVVLIVLVGIVTSKKNNNSPAKETVKVGVLLPLSGDFVAWWGETIKNGIIVAEANGLSKNIEFVYKDTQCNTKDAVSGTQSLKALYPTMHIFIVGCDNDLKAMLPILNKDTDLAFVAGLSGSDLYASHFPIINLSYRLEDEGKSTVNLLNLHPEVKTMGVIYGNNTFGQVVKDTIASQFNCAGCKTISEQIKLSEPDPKTSVLKLLQGKPDAIFIHNDIPTISAVLKDLDQFGYKGLRIVTYAGRDQSLIDTAGKASEGTYVSWVVSDQLNQVQKDFIDQYKKMFTKDPFVTSYFVYDGIALLGEANNVCGGDARCIEQYFYNKKDFNNVLGNVTFEPNGQVARSFFFEQIKGGEFVQVDK